LGRSELQTASAIRSADGSFRQSDFRPINPLSNITTNSDQAEHMTATLDDSQSGLPIPVVIQQETIDYGQNPERAIIIFRYHINNSSLERITNLYFGMMTDFDLGTQAEQVVLDSSLGVLSYSALGQPVVGLVALNNMTSFKSFDNGAYKRGFSKAEQFRLISSPSNMSQNLSGDIFTLISGGPFILDPGDSVEIAFAIVLADDQIQLFDRAISAREIYMAPTSTDIVNSALPSGYKLMQNYPNPFNPSTRISFNLPQAQTTALEIYNVLGQQVSRTNLGYLEAGLHTLEWDGKAETGEAVSSGVYFYRLLAGDFIKTRKMMLLR